MNIFDDDKNKTYDIPDFIEDKDDDSVSVDMSIFDLPDEELYDDVKKKDKPRIRKKSNTTIILCIIVIVILLATTAIGVILAIKGSKSASKLEDELKQVKATISDYQNQINTKDATISALSAEIEKLKNSNTIVDSNNKYPSGTRLWITADGSNQGVRVSADTDSDTAKKSDGSSYVLYWGDDVKLISDATKDSDGNYWGKIDGGFIRIEFDGEIWASTQEQ